MVVFQTNDQGAVRAAFETTDGDIISIGINADQGVRFPANAEIELDEQRLLNVAQIVSAPLGITIKGFVYE